MSMLSIWPISISFARSGLVACSRALALTAPGDCLFKLVVAGKVSEVHGDHPLMEGTMAGTAALAIPGRIDR